MPEVAPVASGLFRYEKMRAYYSKTGKVDNTKKLAGDKKIIMKWAGLWRTIILSSLGRTLYPYCQSIRTLDLDNLRTLIIDTKFRDETCK